MTFSSLAIQTQQRPLWRYNACIWLPSLSVQSVTGSGELAVPSGTVLWHILSNFLGKQQQEAVVKVTPNKNQTGKAAPVRPQAYSVEAVT